ncbi:MAG: hypothetical protein WA748_07645, partial [Candidatus Acidiferrum sp.]
HSVLNDFVAAGFQPGIVGFARRRLSMTCRPEGRRYTYSIEVTMPITITLLPSNEDGSGSNLFYAIGTLTFSGNYPTGGDTMDFTTVADKLPSDQIIQIFADSQNGNAGYYVPVLGTALNNWKLKAFSGGGTELTAGAYPASVTTDIVQVTITARKLQ